MGVFRFLRRLIAGETDGRPKEPDEYLSKLSNKSFSSRDIEIVKTSAQTAVRVVNESIKIANESKNVETRRSRLKVAREKIESLKKMALQFPFLGLTNLSAVEDSINKVETETEALMKNKEKNYDMIDTWRDNSDICSGLQFHATMSKNTPLSVLEHHGEIFHDINGTPPTYGTKADGIWIIRVKPWSELTNGRITDEFHSETMASDVGQIPCDGGGYLSFLKDFRRIVEQGLPTKEKIILLKKLIKNNPKYKKYAEPYFAEKFFKIHISNVPGIGTKTADSLNRAGIKTLKSLARKTDKEILSIKGIGPAILKVLRQYYELMEEHL